MTPYTCKDCSEYIINGRIKPHILADFLLRRKGLYMRYTGFAPVGFSIANESWNVITLPIPAIEYDTGKFSYRDRLNQIMQIKDTYYLLLPPFAHTKVYKRFTLLLDELDNIYPNT